MTRRAGRLLPTAPTPREVSRLTARGQLPRSKGDVTQRSVVTSYVARGRPLNTYVQAGRWPPELSFSRSFQRPYLKTGKHVQLCSFGYSFIQMYAFQLIRETHLPMFVSGDAKAAGRVRKYGPCGVGTSRFSRAEDPPVRFTVFRSNRCSQIFFSSSLSNGSVSVLLTFSAGF